jgi:hypothetical protein
MREEDAFQDWRFQLSQQVLHDGDQPTNNATKIAARLRKQIHLSIANSG